MRKALLGGLRIVVPVALGLWLIWYSYDRLDPQQRAQVFEALRTADLRWLAVSAVIGLASHLSRAWRWRYLLAPLGHRVGFLNAYNAVMSGYFMNMLLPRAGEASRAVLLGRAENVPFEKGFGTILGERAVDMVMLLCIAGVTVLLQVDKLDLIQERIAAFRATQATGDTSDAWPWWLVALAASGALVLVAGLYLLATRPALRAKAKATLRGLYEGMAAVFRTPHKGPFLFHSVLIWLLYVGMFAVGFMALPGTREVPFAGIMAGFIAGTIGIVLVQGGIGVYPAFVAVIISIYMPTTDGGLMRPDALALGWLLWIAQTLLTIALGGLSLLLISRTGKPTTP